MRSNLQIRSQYTKENLEPESLKSKSSTLLEQLRFHQWVKNILVFVPLISSHSFFSQEIWIKAIIAFFSFCAIASSVYCLNDLVDLKNDKNHSTKSRRPLPSGRISSKIVKFMLCSMFTCAVFLGNFLPDNFLLCVGGYFVANLLYSFWAKRETGLDLLCLSLFYCIRIIAGSVATNIEISNWLLTFSIFIFFGLACLKRYTECLRTSPETKIAGRGYTSGDQQALIVLGISSSLMSVLVLALYFSTGSIGILYQHPQRLWLLQPLILIWIARVWVIGARRQIDDDPVVFTMRDKASWVLLLCFCFILYFSL